MAGKFCNVFDVNESSFLKLNDGFPPASIFKGYDIKYLTEFLNLAFQT